MSGPVKVDVLVVGSGAAGLSAAVTAAMHGASVMVAEKASVLGGTSAWSGGWLWIPRNPLARAEGIDEAADALGQYARRTYRVFDQFDRFGNLRIQVELTAFYL